MSRKNPIDISEDSKQALPLEGETGSRGVRRLTDQEILELRRDMMESSAWAKEELARRRKKQGERS
ncbi:hypothetical protein C6H59_12605 [Vibrio cholerae]